MSDAAAKPPTILVIDDDAEIRYSLSRVLSARGYQMLEAASGEEGIALVKKGPPPDLVFLDVRMGGMSGIEALQHIRSANPRQLVVLMTAFGTAQTAIEAMKYGAFDYVMKPFDPAKVLNLAQTALQAHADLRAVGDYQPSINVDDYREGIVGGSPVMQEVFKIIGQVTASDVTVMITGESGTGKELIARAVHEQSPRSQGPFVAVSGGALPPDLLESELFGHTRGAFTGAVRDRTGRFEAASKGTIFLDEIGGLPLSLQVKLLRVLQDGTFERVGENHTRTSHARVIAATNIDLARAVREGRFRSDLYFRLRVVPIEIAPLRHRREDIEPIARALLARIGARHGRSLQFSPDVLRVLMLHDWPGNARELENAIEFAVAVCDGQTILPDHLPALAMLDPVSTDAHQFPDLAPPAPASGAAGVVSGPTDTLRNVLDAHQWRRDTTAQALGVSRITLWRRMRKAGLI